MLLKERLSLITLLTEHTFVIGRLHAGLRTKEACANHFHLEQTESTRGGGYASMPSQADKYEAPMEQFHQPRLVQLSEAVGADVCLVGGPQKRRWGR